MWRYGAALLTVLAFAAAFAETANDTLSQHHLVRCDFSGTIRYLVGPANGEPETPPASNDLACEEISISRFDDEGVGSLLRIWFPLTGALLSFELVRRRCPVATVRIVAATFTATAVLMTIASLYTPRPGLYYPFVTLLLVLTAVAYRQPPNPKVGLHSRSRSLLT